MIINPAGLSYDRIRGDDAGAMIVNAAVTTDVINSVLFFGQPYVSVLSLLGDVLTRIQPDSYYIHTEVKNCIIAVQGIQGILLGAAGTLLLSESCRLDEDHQFTDYPFPRL